MHWADDFIAADWGTTHRRAYAIRKGECVAEFDDDCGVLAIAAGGFPGAVDAIRTRLGDAPLLMAGMVGSNRGWVETAYVPCPAGIADLARNLHWVEPGRIAIVPGLSIRSETQTDVMRGEEVQIFGALASGAVGRDEVLCHPGTHNKWVSMAGGQIASFRTVMTGEMFALLRAHGILSAMLVGEVTPGDAFRSGVARGLQSPTLTAELFSVRARVLLGVLAAGDAAAFVSGLLIGADLAVGISIGVGKRLNIVGDPALTGLYAAAARTCDRDAHVTDGREAFLAGAVALARMIE